LLRAWSSAASAQARFAPTASPAARLARRARGACDPASAAASAAPRAAAPGRARRLVSWRRGRACRGSVQAGGDSSAACSRGAARRRARPQDTSDTLPCDACVRPRRRDGGAVRGHLRSGARGGVRPRQHRRLLAAPGHAGRRVGQPGAPGARPRQTHVAALPAALLRCLRRAFLHAALHMNAALRCRSGRRAVP